MQNSKINMKIKQSLERDHYMKIIKNTYCHFRLKLITASTVNYTYRRDGAVG